MKVVQRINEILKDKQINKRELARRLINLDMKAHKTGETPTESSWEYRNKILLRMTTNRAKKY